MQTIPTIPTNEIFYRYHFCRILCGLWKGWLGGVYFRFFSVPHCLDPTPPHPTPPHPTPPHLCSYKETPHLPLPLGTPPFRYQSVTHDALSPCGESAYVSYYNHRFCFKLKAHYDPPGPQNLCPKYVATVRLAHAPIVDPVSVLFFFFNAFVFYLVPKQQRGWVRFSNAVRLRNCNHGKGDAQYSLRFQHVATGCVQSPYCWGIALALKIDPQNALFFKEKLNPTHKIHGIFISISWLPPCVWPTPLLSLDSFFCSF